VSLFVILVVDFNNDHGSLDSLAAKVMNQQQEQARPDLFLGDQVELFLVADS
jgi:hypothetical protein